MKVTNLTIENWCAIGHAQVRLDDQGLVLIQGINKDDTSQISNGAGKSTIAEALSWVLFNETAKTEGGDAVVNLKEGKNASVVAELYDENTGDLWRVSRYRKHKTYKNMLRLELQQDQVGTLVWLDKTAGTDKLTQVLVDQVVGCNYEVFKAAIYAAQEAMPDLPAMTDKQLKVLVEESAGIAQLQLASELATKAVKEAKAKVAESTSKIMAIQATIQTLQDGITAAEAHRDDWEKDRQAKIQDVEDAKKIFHSKHDATLGARIEAGIKKVNDQIDEVVAKISGTDAERDEERRLAQEAQNAEVACAQAEAYNKSKLKAADQAKHRRDHVANAVGSKCSECGHTIEAGDLADAGIAAQEALDIAIAESTAAVDAYGSAVKRAIAAKRALDDHRASMTDISAQNALQSDLRERGEKLVHALKNWKQELVMLDNYDKQIANLSAAVNPYLKVIDDNQARLDAAKLDIDALDAIRQQQQEDLEVEEYVARVYSPAGVRAHILDTVTPYLNSQTAHYLSGFTDGNVSAVWSTISTTTKGELREKFVIDVLSRTGGGTFKSLSGGEKRKVRLACAMALQDLVASRASKPINLWIADEIDHALDPAGLERLMSILEEKARNKGTVLVISHTDLTDSIKQSITVVKEHGKSTIAA